MYPAYQIMPLSYITDNNKRGLRSLLIKNNDIILPLCKPLRTLLIRDVDEEAIMPYTMQYHDAALIASCINRYIPGFIIDGGFMRELYRAFSELIINKNTKLETGDYYICDLDIHLSSDYEIDYEAFIKEEKRTYFILNAISNALNDVNCKITGLNDKDIDLKTKFKSYKDITLYNLDIKVGNKKSKFQITESLESSIYESSLSHINTQIIFNPKGKFCDFVCNQLCLSKNYDDDFNGIKRPVLGMKEQCYDYLQKFANQWKRKVKKIFSIYNSKIPDIIINKIMSYLNFDVRKRIEQDTRFGSFYLDRQALSRCKLTSSMNVDDVFEQLAKKTTYFIGECGETGCIPYNENTDIDIIGNLDLYFTGFKWDQTWATKNNMDALMLRITKLKNRGIRVINKCSENNPNCLWYCKNSKFDKFENLY